MSDLTLNDYAEFALHQRAAGRTVVADVIDALVDARGFVPAEIGRASLLATLP